MFEVLLQESEDQQHPLVVQEIEAEVLEPKQAPNTTITPKLVEEGVRKNNERNPRVEPKRSRKAHQYKVKRIPK